MQENTEHNTPDETLDASGHLAGRERTVRAHGLELWAEDFGDPGHPTVLLVMGAQGQGIQWNDGIVRRLVTGGLHVIRYDHRDTGRSSTVDFAAHPYTIADMASDALAVLDSFGVERAHLVGASAGGLMAQILALGHPTRVLTLTVLSSQPLGTDTAGVIERALTGTAPRPGELPPPTAELLAALTSVLVDPEGGPEDYLATRLRLWRALHGTVLPFDEDEYREMEERVHARARDLRAPLNHTFAGAAGVDHEPEDLAAVTAPTLVLHGSEDPMFPPEHGEATAAAIPGARLVVLRGMGHTLPKALDGDLADEILRHTATRTG
jgi:pimeloyl-ACP methyl ester carboxylesterase